MLKKKSEKIKKQRVLSVSIVELKKSLIKIVYSLENKILISQESGGLERENNIYGLIHECEGRNLTFLSTALGTALTLLVGTMPEKVPPLHFAFTKQ